MGSAPAYAALAPACLGTLGGGIMCMGGGGGGIRGGWFICLGIGIVPGGGGSMKLKFRKFPR
uniref:Uncharacterized protein n=1 Tax=Ciona savignyi TaxID=51511 RepID=H2ZDF0_CIOSA